MTVMKTFLVVAVLTGLLAYYLYCPAPQGYSPESTRALTAFLSSMKFVDILAKAMYTVGLDSSVAASNRRITNYAKSWLGIPGVDNEIKEVDAEFDGVPVRIYEPVNRTGVLPGFVFYHGGGWAIGDLDTVSDVCRRLCKQVNAVVVSVDYRLAPEHLFPAAFEDSVTAAKYFITNAAQFNVDSKRIAVGGESAGGNLAATVSLKLRDEMFQPPIKLQILIYPVVQGLDFQLPSYLKNADGPLLTRRTMAYFTLMYLEGSDDKMDMLLDNGHVSPAVKKQGLPYIDVSKLPSKYLVGYEKPSVDSGNEALWDELKDKLLNPYFSPIVARSLENLPPAYVFTAEHDPLRDEGILYARRLQESGVKVTLRHSDIAIHVMMGLAGILPEADELFREMTDFIANNL